MARRGQRPAGMMGARLATVVNTLTGIFPRHATLVIFLYAAVLLISIGLMQSAFATLFQGVIPAAVQWLVGVMIFLVVAGAPVVYVQRQYAKLRGTFEKTKVIEDTYAGVILTLSSLTPDAFNSTRDLMASAPSRAGLIAMLENTRHPWHQGCRALAVHGAKLRWVGVVVSRESKDQADLFEQVAQLYLQRPRERLGFQASAPVDITQLEQVMTAVQKLIDRAIQGGIPADLLVIDITSGTKMASVAGVMAALGHRELLAVQYVDTNPPNEVFEVAYRAYLADG